MFALWLLPLAWLLWATAHNQLGANPAQALQRASGDWALRALCLALAVTPLRQWLHIAPLARYRRMLGLFACFYASVHALAYAWLDQDLSPAAIVADAAQRPFILVGLGSMGLLWALAATSPHRMLRLLGGKRWQRLHRCVHAAAALALLHFYWMRSSKNDTAEVAAYAAVLALLWLARWAWAWRAP